MSACVCVSACLCVVCECMCVLCVSACVCACVYVRMDPFCLLTDIHISGMMNSDSVSWPPSVNNKK